MTFPLTYGWDGEAFRPLPRFAKMADQQFVIGELYQLEQVHGRSSATHNHQFAFLAQAWRNLPERFDNEPWANSPETMRKHALIICKFCTVEAFVCASKAEAERWAKVLRQDEEYCIITIDGTTIHRFKAESQSKRTMGAKRFQESKTALLEWVSSLVEVAPAALQHEGEAA